MISLPAPERTQADGSKLGSSPEPACLVLDLGSFRPQNCKECTPAGAAPQPGVAAQPALRWAGQQLGLIPAAPHPTAQPVRCWPVAEEENGCHGHSARSGSRRPIHLQTIECLNASHLSGKLFPGMASCIGVSLAFFPSVAVFCEAPPINRSKQVFWGDSISASFATKKPNLKCPGFCPPSSKRSV